jgi:hypothetical protein
MISSTGAAASTSPMAATVVDAWEYPMLLYILCENNGKTADKTLRTKEWLAWAEDE